MNLKIRGAVLALVAIALLALAGCGEDVAPPPPEPATGEKIRARHVELEGQPNFRDLGGYRTVDGRAVKWGQVYRSGELGQLTNEDLTALEDLELRTVVNFLLPEEIDQHGPDRRDGLGLTDEEIERLRDQLLESVLE